MEYLLGSLLTLVSIVVANKLVNKKLIKYKVNNLIYSQSVVHEVLSPFIPTNQELKEKILKTQSTAHRKKSTMRVLFVEDMAYWIKDNTFYSANVVDGFVDEESTKRVDTMGMDKVQLREMSFIVEKLTEGIDDENRYSGK
jgi:hypothetical protein